MWLDKVGSTECMVRHRLQAARGMFHKYASILCSPSLPPAERLRKFAATVGSCALWGAGCWVPSISVQRSISGQENRWLRRMLAPRKLPTEPWVDWLRREKRLAHDKRYANNQPALWHRALYAIHGWAGHLARNDSAHPARAAVWWRFALWWEATQIFGPGSGECWRHPRTNWTRGFEHALVEHLGSSWWLDAQEDRAEWRRASRIWVHWACRKWGGPTQIPRNATGSLSRAPGTA